ncbi:MAG TPA: PAS domain-containing sensor histidine kinase, partial [Polyangiales bacterium]
MDTPQIPEESVEELYEDAPCGYLSCAEDGSVVRANATLLGWLGYTRDEVVGKRSFISFLTLPGRVFHETNLAPLLHMQGFVNEIALDLLCKDGSRLPALLNCKKVQSGNACSLRFSVFDASDRRRYERELLLERRRAEQAAQAKAEFLATVSHEIRNHLHSIAAVSQLLALGSDTTQHERYVELLSAASSSLLNLVDDILDYSKMEAGKLALDERPINLRDVIQGVAAGVRARAEVRELALLVEVDERVPPLLVADPIKLAQVLTNLCSNAIKYTARGWIKLWVSLVGHEHGKANLRLGVKDSGAGIPARDLPALCEAFTRVSKEGSARVRSTGLGLSICKRILGLYQSQLLVESVEGSGSDFFFEISLPIAELPAERHMLRDLTRTHTLHGVR